MISIENGKYTFDVVEGRVMLTVRDAEPREVGQDFYKPLMALIGFAEDAAALDTTQTPVATVNYIEQPSPHMYGMKPEVAQDFIRKFNRWKEMQR